MEASKSSDEAEAPPPPLAKRTLSERLHEPWAVAVAWIATIIGGIAVLYTAAAALIDRVQGEVPSASPAAPLDQYMNSTGEHPPLVPPENRLFGFTIGSPLDAAREQFGREDERYDEQEGVVGRQWYKGPLVISVSSNQVDAVESISVSRFEAEEGDPWRVALPDGLVLGESTVGDLERRLGEPHEIALENLEGMVCQLSYRRGPEGTNLMQFWVLPHVDPLDASVEANVAEVCTRDDLLLTSYFIH